MRRRDVSQGLKEMKELAGKKCARQREELEQKPGVLKNPDNGAQ